MYDIQTACFRVTGYCGPHEIYIVMPAVQNPVEPYCQIVSNGLGQFFRIQQRISERIPREFDEIPRLEEIQALEEQFQDWANGTNANMPRHIAVSLEARMRYHPRARDQLREELQRLLRNLEAVYYFIGVAREEEEQQVDGAQWFPEDTVGIRPYVEMTEVALGRLQSLARLASPITQAPSVAAFAMNGNSHVEDWSYRNGGH